MLPLEQHLTKDYPGKIDCQKTVSYIISSARFQARW